MTYGGCTAEIMGSLAGLLQHHAPATASPEPLMRYRDVVLVFCAEALEGCWDPGRKETGRAAVIDAPTVIFRQRLAAVSPSEPASSMSTVFATRHRGGELRLWQRAARAAVVAERELAAAAPGLTSEQRWVLVKDAADITRAISSCPRRRPAFTCLNPGQAGRSQPVSDRREALRNRWPED